MDGITFSSKGRDGARLISIAFLAIGTILLCFVAWRFSFPWSIAQIAAFFIALPIIVWIMLHSIMTIVNYPSWRVEDGKLVYPIRPFKHHNIFWRAGVVPLERLEGVHIGLTSEFANAFGIDPKTANEPLKDSIFFVVKGRSECLSLRKRDADMDSLNKALEGKVRITDVYSPYPNIEVVEL